MKIKLLFTVIILTLFKFEVYGQTHNRQLTEPTNPKDELTFWERLSMTTNKKKKNEFSRKLQDYNQKLKEYERYIIEKNNNDKYFKAKMNILKSRAENVKIIKLDSSSAAFREVQKQKTWTIVKECIGLTDLRNDFVFYSNFESKSYNLDNQEKLKVENEIYKLKCLFDKKLSIDKVLIGVDGYVDSSGYDEMSIKERENSAKELSQNRANYVETIINRILQSESRVVITTEGKGYTSVIETGEMQRMTVIRYRIFLKE